MPKLALVRAFGGEPLCRAVCSLGNEVIFVSSITSKTQQNQWFPPPIGVPIDDVFSYDEPHFIELRSRWKSGGQICEVEWGRPFDVAEMKEAAN